MAVFEMILALLLVAVLLVMAARRVGVPYPTLLALMGVAVSFAPGLPALEIPPDLILALLVAPVLLDAAHDMSFRDLRRNWPPVLSLVVVAVGLTTAAVAIVVRWFLPDMPWGAAIALGALLAPPDAVAAVAVMRQVEPPNRIRAVLEGESLLNDASSLLIYRLAVIAVTTGGLSVTEAVPAFLLVAVGSVVVGWVLAHAVVRLIRRVEDTATATVLQFVTTFGVWLLAERLHLSGVITIVTLAITAARAPTSSMPATVRVSSFATWETTTFVLNVLAFLLIGLELRPILPLLMDGRHMDWLAIAVANLGVVIVVRFAWVFLYRSLSHDDPRRPDAMSPAQSFKAALVVGWSGMRGIVTLAAALALPIGFPYRDLILLTAFVVVLGTLVLQGLTLRPLLRLLDMPRDTLIHSEVQLARAKALMAALAGLSRQDGPAALRLRQEYEAALASQKSASDSEEPADNVLRRQVVEHARKAIDELRDSGRIGDDAYRQVEQELDWLELSSRKGAA
jgi:CPA1 family monovalent cation:H+ antiporter